MRKVGFIDQKISETKEFLLQKYRDKIFRTSNKLKESYDI